MFSNLMSQSLEDHKKYFKILSFFDLQKIRNTRDINYYLGTEYETSQPEYFNIDDNILSQISHSWQVDELIQSFSEALQKGEEIKFFSDDEEEDEDQKSFDKRIFEKYYDDLISLNNFLCILHESVSKTAPFRLSSKKEQDSFRELNKHIGDEEYLEITSKLKPNEDELKKFYNLKEPEEVLDLDNYEEDINNFYDNFDKFMISESRRWLSYVSNYIPGYTISSVLIFLEKFLIDVSEYCIEKEMTNIKFVKKSKSSIIDGRINHLREECDLKFEIPPKIAEVIFNTRIARNLFTHGNWDEIEKYFLNFKASEIINSTLELVCIVCLSIRIKMNKLKI